MLIRLFIIAFTFGLYSLFSYAKPILILHTNDLHGFVENSVYDASQGGYARLKTLIEQERSKANARGISTITLDGGDFLEGSLFYMSDRVKSVFNMMDKMNYDAVALGNHDWLMGTAELGHLLSDVDFSFVLVAANIEADRNRFVGLKKLKSHRMMEIDGHKIAILGLTTDENNFKWVFDKGHIADPIKTANKWGKKLKAMGAQTVIALTHLGFTKDQELVSKTSDIDLVVGGHSHTLIDRPYITRNKQGRQVAIVQAGEHAKYLGKLLIDIAEDGSIKVLEREIVPVTSSIDEDPIMRQLISEARTQVNNIYGESYLKTVVGFTEIDLINSSGMMTPWNKIIADSFKESINADIGVHSPNLTGIDIPKGAISREQIMHTYPRFFSLDDRWGWHIYHVEMYGMVAKMLMEYYLKGGESVILSGVNFRVEVNKKGKKKIKDITIGGEPIRLFKKYKVAFPEGVIKGGLGMIGVLIDLIHSVDRTEINLWDALEAKVRRLGTIRGDYLIRPGVVADGKEKSFGDEADAVFIP
ncbi:MAG: bifunctional metallophosphatase/5'-nucleotidase [Bdellovibrio sp.]|nr:bifunctional metallophosphatase/5'-nucleotidase [Bdellovibrio sp.]